MVQAGGACVRGHPMGCRRFKDAKTGNCLHGMGVDAQCIAMHMMCIVVHS
jgi:hypothetical protein